MNHYLKSASVARVKGLRRGSKPPPPGDPPLFPRLGPRAPPSDLRATPAPTARSFARIQESKLNYRATKFVLPSDNYKPRISGQIVRSCNSTNNI
ncbi:hypothetical protein EVAR_55401_1 [Eumeta japonica]|uniref:Uncharacterized protein n=1 Tax=Eumeta variegata TaxID=151549 RepID=A0A4C1YTL3_EUMVA|nr:hypothetical protein EVAR_55401_1 [Eumeta japonica]